MAESCPDGGTCHHGCAEPNCWRVEHAEPLSGVYPNDEWPLSVRAASVAQRWRDRSQQAQQAAEQALDRALDLSPWNQALYGALHEELTYKSGGMQFRWQGEGFAVFEPGPNTQTRLLYVPGPEAAPALHTLSAYRRGHALFAHTEVDMRVFRDDMVPMESPYPTFLHCRSQESASVYTLCLHLEGQAPMDVPLGYVYSPQTLASHRNPIATELARTLHQPILFQNNSFILPSPWAVDALNADRLEYVAKKETREAPWLRPELRTQWVFESEEAFQDWAIGELEKR